MVAWLLERERERYFQRCGKPLDFSRVYWTSPVTPQEAYRLECRQIEDTLGLRPFVSITDHDDIEANLLLQVIEGGEEIPISTEWTVPVENTFFHFGVHNLPKPLADVFHAKMQQFRGTPSPEDLREILAALVAHPDVLIVLNHPLWDEAGIGQTEHEGVLARLLSGTPEMIHALELNGLRTWKENLRVLELGESLGMPAISGGDRHGHEPNALLNVSRADSFAGFAEEVRGGESHVVVMPQYRENRKLRCFQTAWDMIREHPEHPFGKVSCLDRSYLIRESGEHATLASLFTNGTPALLEKVLWAVRLLESPQLRPALRVALSDGEGLPS
ncbi:MAG: hypothetical protein U5J83_10115 [Bryobacterales bacterium]|nr:hypothetical protein [Bryobacterales bacterium]